MSIKVKQLNIKEAIKINEILDKKEKEKEKEKEEIEETPIYEKIYPPIKDLFIYDENNEINNNLLKIKSKISKLSKKSNFLEEVENDEMNEEFLNDLVKIPCPISKTKVIDIVSKFIHKSKLIEKLESDYQSDKKIESNSLSKICAEKLNYMELKQGEIVFKIGDSGDRFYFILNGYVSILKTKELHGIEMTYIQYIKYCVYLLNLNEEYLLNEVIKSNHAVLNLSSIEDIKTINKIIFMRQLTDRINKSILNNNHLAMFFEQNGQKFEDYDIKTEELEALEQQKNKGVQGAGKEWENYITKRCKLTVSEQVFFQPFENILTDENPKKICCFVYHSFLYLGPGLFFGDTALDFENSKRNATIRAEERTILAYLKRHDYLNIISPKHKMEKLKEIEFIYEKFFFGGINSHIFEKNYFHLFSPREYYRGNILFSHGTIPRSLILLKSGRISLELKGSVIDIHNLIKFIYNNIFTNPIFSKISQGNKNKYLPNDKLSIIKNFINDPILTRLKMHNSRFIEEMNVVRVYQIKILTKNETIGLEEIFLRLPYLMKSTVISEKIYCYELALEHIDKILNTGKDIVHSYIKFSMNKIISLIERFQNIKQNNINMSLVKYEKEMLKYRGWKNAGNDLNKKNDENNKKDEKVKSKSRNKKLINNDTNNNKDREINNDTEKQNSTILNQNNSSPIKLFMTNISPKSKSLFEKMQLAFKKIQKRQIKYKNNQLNSLMNNSINLKNSYSNKNIKSNNDKNRNTHLFKTIGVNKSNSYNNSQFKEQSQTSYINIKDSNMSSKFTHSNILPEKNEEKNQNDKSNTENRSAINPKNNNEPNLHKKAETISINTFNFSYVPLDLICQNQNTDERNKPFVSNINKLLTLNKKTIDIYNNVGVVNNPNNNIKNNKNDRMTELKNRLKIINKKYQIIKKNKGKNIGNSMNIINKQDLMSSIIKDFYKDIRLNGYISFIHNKEINTVFMRKYNKKYDSAEKASNNIKMHLLKRSDSLPLIF